LEVVVKTAKTQIRELRAELHYWQMRVRMDMKSLQGTKEKCKEIGMKLRALQTLDKREPRV
jgi:hypothetical protein